MDIIEVLLEGHAALRGEFAALTAPFERPHGVGWDDRVALDKKRLLRDIRGFFAAFKTHETVEDEFLAEVLRLVELNEELRAASAAGHRSMGEMMKLFGAVACSCDGRHVYPLRAVLFRLGEELETHLTYEEKILFPMLRERLPVGLLRELGRRAQEGSQKTSLRAVEGRA